VPRHYSLDGSTAVGSQVVASTALREAVLEVTAALDRNLNEDERRHRELLAQLAVLCAAIQHSRTERPVLTPEDFAEHLLHRLEKFEERPRPAPPYRGETHRNGNGETKR
jgi:hypothetical protein